MRNEALWINMEEYKWANRDVSNSPDDEVNPVKNGLNTRILWDKTFKGGTKGATNIQVIILVGTCQ